MNKQGKSNSPWTHLSFPIVSKVFESIVLKPHIDPRQFGSISGTGTTDMLIEMTHNWYEVMSVFYYWITQKHLI